MVFFNTEYNYSNLLYGSCINKKPVDLFGKPDLSPTFFDNIYWKNYTRPFIDGVYSEYLFNSVIIATSNAVLVTILALMATYALSRFNLAAADNIFFWTMSNIMAPPVAFLLPLFLLFSTVFRIGDHSYLIRKLD